MIHRLVLILALLAGLNAGAGIFRVATYNVENYLLEPTASRPQAKTAAARAKIREALVSIRPDVLALEEIGDTNALLELRAALKADGCDFPFWEFVRGADTNIHIAVLSRLPVIASRPHVDESFLLDGRLFRVCRGFAEVKVQADRNFSFTLLAAHLKSRRAVPEADEAELRWQEAKVLRSIVDKRFRENPDAHLVVLGDFNDLKNSPTIKEIIGRGRFKLIDTRPAERNGDTAPNPVPYFDPRDVTWTHYFGLEDTYSRIDYILLSPAMARHWLRGETYLPVIPNWGLGSDHRPVVAGFSTTENESGL